MLLQEFKIDVAFCVLFFALSDFGQRTVIF